MGAATGRFLTIAGLLALALAASGCAGPGWSDSESASFAVRVAHVPGSALSVFVPRGDIEIAVDPTLAEIVVEGKLICGGVSGTPAKDRAEAAGLRTRRNEAGRLLIEPLFPGGPHPGDTASLVIRLPGARDVTVGTQSGEIHVRGTNGELHVEGAHGPITVTNHDGPLSVRNTAASVTVTGARAPTEITTTSGTVILTLRPDARGPVDVESLNGTVRITVGRVFAGRLALTAPNGTVTVRDPGGLVRRQVFSGDRTDVEMHIDGPPSWINAPNGRIALTVVP